MKRVLLLIIVILSIFVIVSCKQETQHEHTFNSTWAYNADYHWHEASCGHDVTSGNSAHSWNEGTVTTPPTHTTDGVKTYTCTVCGAVKTETVPANTEDHTFSTTWSSDSNYHWHAASCIHTDVFSDKEEHVWNAGVDTTPATCTKEGVRTFTCTVCGLTKTESITALGHAYDSGVITTPAGCTTTGIKTFTCANCGESYTEDVSATGHAYSSEWTTDASYHWHAATCGHTEEKGSYGTHSFPSEATAVDQGDGTYKFEKKCTECGYSVVVSSANVGDIGPAGGIVFYDKGEYSDGWRFLEAAPRDLGTVDGVVVVNYTSTKTLYFFGYYRNSYNGSNLYVNGTKTYNAANCTGKAIGTGKSNTELLVNAMGNNPYSQDSGAKTIENYPAKLCSDLEYNGFDDWFLPSRDELVLMCSNMTKIGGFVTNDNYYYWSSSESYEPTRICAVNFKEGFVGDPYRKDYARVRAIRAF